MQFNTNKIVSKVNKIIFRINFTPVRTKSFLCWSCKHTLILTFSSRCRSSISCISDQNTNHLHQKLLHLWGGQWQLIKVVKKWTSFLLWHWHSALNIKDLQLSLSLTPKDYLVSKFFRSRYIHIQNQTN